MAEKDHPEIDNTELLDATGTKQYQSLIGALQCLITLGCFDIQLTVADIFCILLILLITQLPQTNNQPAVQATIDYLLIR
jgi:hypothetical protein